MWLPQQVGVAVFVGVAFLELDERFSNSCLDSFPIFGLGHDNRVESRGPFFVLANMILMLVDMPAVVPTVLLGGLLTLLPDYSNAGLHTLILSSGLS